MFKCDYIVCSTATYWSVLGDKIKADN
ncbi:uncharacterized protein METZ01_LOCUS152503, partial [marine metagenome]